MNDSLQVVLLDAVGTLIRPDPDVGDVYSSAGRRYGSRHDRAAIRARFAQAMARHQTPERTSEPHERRRWRRIVAEVFDDVPAAGEALFKELWAHFAAPRHWRLYDDVAPAWSRLRERNLRIGIASNFDQRLAAICAAFRPLAAADRLYISSQIGYPKPHPGFYRHVQSELGVAADQILLVGDDPVNDVRAARQAGWQALWLRRETPADRPGTIQRLTDLADRLESMPGK